MAKRWVPVVVLALLAATAGVPAGADGSGVYAVAELGALQDGGSLGPTAVDSSGRVVGVASTGTSLRAFLHDGVTLRELPPLPGHTESAAHDLSETGIVVGSSSVAGDPRSTAVVWDDTGVRALEDLGGGGAVALGVSDDGTVVGSATGPDGSRQGVRWRDGQVTVLDDVLPLPAGTTITSARRVDDAGRMIGGLRRASGEPVGFWFDGTKVQEVQLEPGAPVDLVAFGPTGVLGTSGGPGITAFLWREGVAVALPPIPGDRCTVARDLDVDGRAVGESSACGRDLGRAVLWQGGRAIDLQTLLPGSLGWRLQTATAIARGLVAAGAVDADNRNRALLLTPDRSLESYAGPDRIDTALAVASAAVPGRAPVAVLVNRRAPADAAVAAVLATRQRAPLLLTAGDSLDPRVEQALRDRLDPGGTVVLVGGEGALSRSVADRVAALGHPVVRHGGVDRHETAVRVAEALGGPGRVVLVSGGAADAPAAVPVAVHEGAALLWTDGTALPAATRTYLDARPGWPRTAIGRAAGADPTAESLRGADRTATAVLVADRFFPWPAVVTFAPAERLIDGVLAGRLAAAAGGPVLVAGELLPTDSGSYLAGLPFLPAFRTVGAISSGVSEGLAPFAG
jgi:uncharacterized membrane protein